MRVDGSMKERLLLLMCAKMTRKMEDAYLDGEAEKALWWSQRLDKVIYQLMLIQNQHIFQNLRSK